VILHPSARCPYLTPLVLALAQAAYDERPACTMCRDKRVFRRVEKKGGPERGPEKRYIMEPQTGDILCPQCQRRSGTLDPDRLAILADALEEADCGEEMILRHLRGEEPCWDEIHNGNHEGCWQPLRGPHVRGCWCVDLLLSKE
jgi:hypothetical protein